MKIAIAILLILAFTRFLLFLLEKLGSKSGIDGPPTKWDIEHSDGGGPPFFF